MENIRGFGITNKTIESTMTAMVVAPLRVYKNRRREMNSQNSEWFNVLQRAMLFLAGKRATTTLTTIRYQ